jgi:hypothetical protein
VLSGESEQFLYVVDEVLSSCPTFYLIKQFGTLPTDVRDRLQMAVPTQWSDTNVAAMKMNVNVSVPIRRMSSGASDELASLVLTYGEALSKGIMVVIREGTVEVLLEHAQIAARLERRSRDT